MEEIEIKQNVRIVDVEVDEGAHCEDDKDDE